MGQESVKKIVDAYVDVFEQLGIGSFSQGLAEVVHSFEQRLKVLKQIRTREQLQTMLMREPEPEPFILEERIAQIHFLPYMIRKAIPLAMREFAKALPHDPGGRPNSLTDEESRYVCEEIGKLYAQGVTLLDAQDRLARRILPGNCTKSGIHRCQAARRGQGAAG